MNDGQPNNERNDRREGLLEFLERRPKPFTPVEVKQLKRMSPSERRVYDQSRIDHLASDIILNVPQFHRVVDAFSMVQRFNRPRASQATARRFGRRAVLVVGETGTGKTTSCVHALRGLWHDLKLDGLSVRDGDSPFVYVEVPGAATGKSMLRAFTDFFGYPVSDRDPMPRLLERVSDLLIRLDIRVVVIDELQNLAARTTTTGESAQIIKSLYNRLPATFIFSGSDIDQLGPVAGATGAQIVGRSIPVFLSYYPLGSSATTATSIERADRSEWKRLVAAYGAELHLSGQSGAGVQSMAVYLHKRTRGSIGALTDLLVMGACSVIERGLPVGEERLTRRLLDAITLDLKTEQATNWYRSSRDEDENE